MSDTPSQPTLKKSLLSRFLGKTYKSGTAWAVGGALVAILGAIDLTQGLGTNIIQTRKQIKANTAAAKAEWEPKLNEAQKYFKFYTHQKDSSVWENSRGFKAFVTGPNDEIHKMAATIEGKTGYPISVSQDVKGSEFSDMALSSFHENVKISAQKRYVNPKSPFYASKKVAKLLAKASNTSTKTAEKIILLASLIAVPLIGRSAIEVIKNIGR